MTQEYQSANSLLESRNQICIIHKDQRANSLMKIRGRVHQSTRSFLKEVVFFSVNLICGRCDRKLLKSVEVILLIKICRNKGCLSLVLSNVSIFQLFIIQRVLFISNSLEVQDIGYLRQNEPTVFIAYDFIGYVIFC